MKKIPIIFFGSSSQPLPVLQALIDHRDFQVVSIVSQPDRLVGRKQILTPNPVSQFAHQNKIPLFTPKPQKKKYWLYQNPQKLAQQLSKLKPDLLISAHYGQKLPREIIKLASFSGLNLHFSLLPKYRGPAPVQWAIFNGEKKTGITILKIEESFDQGKIVAQEKIKIRPTDTSESLYTRLFQRGTKLLIKIIPDYIKGKIKLTKQDNSQASYYPRLTREHGKIDWSRSSQEIECQIRAFHPWPGTWTKVKLEIRDSKFEVKRLKILKAHLENEKLVLDFVQLEGKKPVSFEEFKKGYPNFQFL